MTLEGNTSLYDVTACVSQCRSWSGAKRVEFKVCLRMFMSEALCRNCCQAFA